MTGVPFAVSVTFGASATSTAVAGVRSFACTAAACRPSPATSRPRIAAIGRARIHRPIQAIRSRACRLSVGRASELSVTPASQLRRDSLLVMDPL